MVFYKRLDTSEFVSGPDDWIRTLPRLYPLDSLVICPKGDLTSKRVLAIIEQNGYSNRWPGFNVVEDERTIRVSRDYYPGEFTPNHEKSDVWDFWPQNNR